MRKRGGVSSVGQSVQVQELGVKADFADDPDGDDIDDLLEESEDPWMREPAGTPIFSCSSSCTCWDVRPSEAAVPATT